MEIYIGYIALHVSKDTPGRGTSYVAHTNVGSEALKGEGLS